jgi:hypothetical protein
MELIAELTRELIAELIADPMPIIAVPIEANPLGIFAMSPEIPELIDSTTDPKPDWMPDTQLPTAVIALPKKLPIWGIMDPPNSMT